MKDASGEMTKENPWKVSPNVVFSEVKAAIEGYYHGFMNQEVPTLAWENLYKSLDNRVVPRKASATILLIGRNASRIAGDLAPILGPRGYILRPVEDEARLTTCDEYLLQTIERDVWSRKIGALVALYIKDGSEDFVRDVICQRWHVHLDRFLSKSSILRSYACRGDICHELLAFNLHEFEIFKVRKLNMTRSHKVFDLSQKTQEPLYARIFKIPLLKLFSMILCPLGRSFYATTPAHELPKGS